MKKRGTLILLKFLLQITVIRCCGEEGSVRLAGSEEPNEGRLEICVGGSWGTVCDDFINHYVALVVCHQLQLHQSYVGTILKYGGGTGQIYHVLCSSTDSSIQECLIETAFNCYHDEDSGIRCMNEPECEETNLRLGHGLKSNSGSIYMCYNGLWRSVCELDFDYREAAIICRHLDFSGDSFPLLGAEKSYDMIDIHCSGTENGIDECDYHVSRCLSDEAGVACSDDPCVHGEHHLVGGWDRSIGRLEYCYEGQWYTVCADDWENIGQEAQVICDSMGLRGVPVVIDYYGRGNNPVLPHNIYCSRSDLNLKDCSTDEMDVSECIRVAGIVCGGFCAEQGIIDCNKCGDCTSDPYYGCSCTRGCLARTEYCCGDITSTQNCIIKECETGAVTLVEGESDSEGYMKICVGGVWGTVCTERISWTENHTSVICRQLGFPTEGAAFRDDSGHFNKSNYVDNVLLGKINCVGTELELLDCIHDTIGATWCDEPSAIFIMCNADKERVCDDGGVRLVSYPNGTSGEIEYCQNGRWKRVCREEWNINNTDVVCSQLNMNETDTTTIVEEENPLFAGRFQCFGYETNLSQCKLDLLPPGRCVSAVVNCEGVTHKSKEKNNELGIVALATIILPMILALILGIVIRLVYSRKQRRRREEMQLAAYKDSLQAFASNKLAIEDPERNYAIVHTSSDNLVLESAVLTNTELSQRLSQTFSNASSSKREMKVPSNYIRELMRNNLLVSINGMMLMESIGEGQFGTVYKGTLKDSYIAIKTLKGEFDQVDVDSFLEECLKMGQFRNENVMNIVGVCLDAGLAPYLIMPYMVNGSLLNYLKKERKNIVLPNETDIDKVKEVRKQLMVMCLQIAKGMKYLAIMKYIHRDLAARNCMLDDNLQIKISDFGLSEDVYEKHYFRQVNDSGEGMMLPVKWMAPESLNHGKFSQKSDVWSYGVTMWEIFCGGKTPYPGSDPRSLAHDLEKGYRMPKPYSDACSAEVYGIMRDCWQTEPEERPTFQTLTLIVVNYTL